MTEGDDSLPAWAEGGRTEDTAAVRHQAKVALQLLANYFHFFAQPPSAPTQLDTPFTSVKAGTPAEDAVKQLRQIFDPATARAVAAWALRVHDVLFEEHEEVIEPNGPSRTYAVMLTSDGQLREITRYVERLFTSTEPRNTSTAKKSITDFLLAWTNAVAAIISVQSRNANSTSERVVRNRFATEILSAANDLEQAIQRADATQDILRNREQAQRATGDTGAAVLGGHYKEVAEQEHISAMTWTAISIGMLIAIVCVGLIVFRQFDPKDWVATLFHLAIVLPMIGIAAFAARLARHHRLLARWAKTAAVQINSVGAFAELMPTDEGREQLILHLGQTVFGPPVFADESKTENVSGIPPGLIELLKEVVKRDAPK